jgi:hypothetical protein
MVAESSSRSHSLGFRSSKLEEVTSEGGLSSCVTGGDHPVLPPAADASAEEASAAAAAARGEGGGMSSPPPPSVGRSHGSASAAADHFASAGPPSVPSGRVTSDTNFHQCGSAATTSPSLLPVAAAGSRWVAAALAFSLPRSVAARRAVAIGPVSGRCLPIPSVCWTRFASGRIVVARLLGSWLSAVVLAVVGIESACIQLWPRGDPSQTLASPSPSPLGASFGSCSCVECCAGRIRLPPRRNAALPICVRIFRRSAADATPRSCKKTSLF